MWRLFLFGFFTFFHSTVAPNPPILTAENFVAAEDENTLFAVDKLIFTPAVACTEDSGNPITYVISSETERQNAGSVASPPAVLKIDSSNGRISIIAASILDYDAIAMFYDIHIQCYVAATGLSSSNYMAVTLQVDDVNEPPILTGTSSFSTTLTEGTALGTNVATTFSFSDPESDTLQYSVTGNVADWIAITVTTNDALSVKINMDYELDPANPVKTGYILCVDSGGSGSTASTSLTVTLIDANDNSPVFSQTTYTPVVTIDMDTAVGTTVTTILATDIDGSSPNNVVTYDVDPGNSDSEYFSVQANGNVVIAYQIDVESALSLVPTFIATDGGSPQNTATATLTIVTPSTTTTTTTTIGPCCYSWLAEDSHKITFIVLLAILGVITAILCYGAYKKWTSGSCLPDFARPEADNKAVDLKKGRTGRNSTSPIMDDDDYYDRPASRGGGVITPSNVELVSFKGPRY